MVFIAELVSSSFHVDVANDLLFYNLYVFNCTYCEKKILIVFANVTHCLGKPQKRTFFELELFFILFPI